MLLFKSIFFSLFIYFPLLAFESLPPSFLFKPNTTKDVSAYFLSHPSLNPFDQPPPFGRVERQRKEKDILYCVKGSENKIYAYAQTLSPTKIAIYSAKKVLLGILSYTPYFLKPPRYEIYNPQNILVAYGDMNWVGSRLPIQSCQNKEKLAQFYRPYFRLPGDYWYLDILSTQLDPNIFIILGAYQCDVERKDSPIRGDN
jgi:hypothetical protein